MGGPRIPYACPPGDEPLDLEPIKAREAKTTNGPWWYDGITFIFTKIARSDQMVAEPRGFGADLPLGDNAEFIAHAREDVPALVREVERLRGLISDHLVGDDKELLANFKKYAEHQRYCKTWSNRCNCGLTEVLKKLG